MRIELLDEAEKDLIDGFGFYEGKSEGLGARGPATRPSGPAVSCRG